MKVGLAILAFVFVIYAPTLGHPYFFDDSHYIVNNAAIQNPANLLKLWTSAKYNSVSPEQWGYRPFTAFVHSLSWMIGGGATQPFHVVKILLHSLVCLLLVLVWKRLWTNPKFFPEPLPRLRLKWGAWEKTWIISPTQAALALAFVFAAHPVNTQVLNYISATTTLLAGTCYLTAYYLYLRFREDSRWMFFVGSLVFYALAVLAKEEGITLCGVILLTELMVCRRENPRRKWIVLFGYFFTGLLLALLLSAMFVESSNLARVGATRLVYFMTQWRAYLRYIALPIWPWGLNADNLEFGFSQSFFEMKVLAALCGNLLLLISAWSFRKRYPIFIFSLLWFYIAVSPASSVIPLAEPVNDHRMYIAYFGLVGLFPWLLKLLDVAFRKISAVPAVIAFFGLIIGTEVRNQVWSSPAALWTDTVEKNPHSPRALNNLALDFMNREEWERSRELLDRCEKLAPTYVVCKVNQGLVLTATGHDIEADEKFRDAIATEPGRPESKSFYAGFLMQRGRNEAALELYRQIDEICLGQDLPAKLGWARAAINLGRADEAKSVLREAIHRFGNRPEIRALFASGGS